MKGVLKHGVLFSETIISNEHGMYNWSLAPALDGKVFLRHVVQSLFILSVNFIF